LVPKVKTLPKLPPTSPPVSNLALITFLRMLPQHLDELRLIAEIAPACDENLGNAVLRKGMNMVEAADYLTKALYCEIPSVHSAAG
jgi:hypothetical protein